MNDFFQYLKAMFEAVIVNIGHFFNDVFAKPWAPVPGEMSDYGDIWNLYSSSFGTGGWICFVIFIILIVAFLGGLFYLLYRLIRKYVIFARSKIHENDLKDQIEKLNYELYKATQEKNRILDLQVQSSGGRGGKDFGSGGEEDISNSRFPKLCAVDNKYASHDATLVMEEQDQIPLDQFCARFRLFAASQLGLYYEIQTIRAFIAGLGTTKLIILEGISGTGKTSLPYAYGKFLQNDAKICSVQPSWRDRSELLGYYNEFTKKFNETDFLKAVYETTYRQDLNVIVLDEMNLARIEYYFAEFLSVMEMPDVSEWNIELINSPDAETDPSHFKDGKLLIPQNCWFIGTANNDDSTFTITDKVYDRAIAISFENKGIPFDCDFAEPMNVSYEYLHRLYEEAKTNFPLSPKTIEKFDKLDDFVIAKFKIAFGNRILKQLQDFVPIYVACGGTELEGLDFIFCTKILKKFEALNLAFFKDELKDLISTLDRLFGRSSFLESKKKIEFMLKMN